MKRRKNILSYLCFLHTFILGAGSVVVLYGADYSIGYFVPIPELVSPILIGFVFAIFLSLISCFLTQDLQYGSLLASIVLTSLFYYWAHFLVIFSALAAGLLVWFIRYKKINIKITNLLLAVVSFSFVGYFSAKIVNVGLSSTEYYSGSVIDAVITNPKRIIPAYQPDIYYIILDGYGRADVLDKVYSMDNGSFISELEMRDFFVGADSNSNYHKTVLSLASSLNMQYLETASDKLGDSYLWWPLKDAIHHSQIRYFLETQGYETISFFSGWDLTDIRDADYHLSPYFVSPKDIYDIWMLKTNMANFLSIETEWVGLYSYNTHRKLITNALKNIPVAAKMEGPQFVFAHIIAPHPPFSFDRYGNPIDPEYSYTISDARDFLGSLDEYESGYTEQIFFINNKIVKMVDEILANSDVPPIIIIQGDHGPGMLTDFYSYENTCLYERYGILNAYYLPGIDRAEIPENLSPVNTFRVVLNQYFDSDMELLENRSYFSSQLSMYKFTDVTDLIQPFCDYP